MSYKVPMRQECLKGAKIGYNQYKCAECNEIFGRKEIKVDHINPVRPIRNPNWTWDEFINNLFCDSKGLQVLCEKHHDIKTKMENTLRREYKKDNKIKLTKSKSHAKINKKIKKGKK